MDNKEIFKSIISDRRFVDLPQIWIRKLEVPLNSGKIITLVGVRRSGKTYHLFNLIKKLLNKGISFEQIIYINFEDERLKLESKDLDLLLQAYRELYPDLDLSKSYFFFDEIQEVDGWEKFISRVYSSISKHIFITGSNSKLLSTEIATALRGRTVTFEIYPLSFKEFVDIKNPNLNINRSADKAKLVKLFEKFMYQGGFPELIGKDANLQSKILQEYFNVMVFKDIVERYKVTQVEVLKYFCKRVIGSSAGEFNPHKVFNELKSQGYKTAKDTIYAYNEYVETAYLARFLPRYFESSIKSEFSQKKVFVIDQGMGAALDFKLNQDKGRLFETTICLELLKSGGNIAYMKNGTECDFVVINKGHVDECLQVAYDVFEKDTKNREINGLVKTCKNFDLKKGLIITMNNEENLVVENIKIDIIPAWKYFYFRK